MVNLEKSEKNSQYHLSVVRKNTGMDGDYETFDAAVDRLKDYGNSFPGEVIEAVITKIK